MTMTFEMLSKFVDAGFSREELNAIVRGEVPEALKAPTPTQAPTPAPTQAPTPAPTPAPVNPTNEQWAEFMNFMRNNAINSSHLDPAASETTEGIIANIINPYGGGN